MKIQDLYTLFVDLDGVMADLDRFLIDTFGETFDDTPEGDDVAWDRLNAMQDRGEKTFEVLPLMPDAMALWNAIRPYRPNILTATGNRYELVGTEKQAWVRANLPDHNQIIVVQKSSHKARYAAPHHVLIDDRMKSIGPWREAGGIGILHTSAADTLRQLRDLGLDVL